MRRILENTTLSQLILLFHSLSLYCVNGFVVSPSFALVPQRPHNFHASASSSTRLFVSIGLGPQDEDKDEEESAETITKVVEYSIPNHEDYRLSRRSKLDEACDEWLEGLVEGNVEDGTKFGSLGNLAEMAYHHLITKVPLVNDKPHPDGPASEEWTPYVSTKLPWTPLTPAHGLEQFGLPAPRRNAEAWRHFDVAGMVAQKYDGASASSSSTDRQQSLLDHYKERLQAKGAWLDDDVCEARLIYVNGRFAPELSKTSAVAGNLRSLSDGNDLLGLDRTTVETYLSRLTDGFSDQLVVPVFNGDVLQTSYSKLSGPDHSVGNATTQFAINTQQGTAVFAALNTMKTVDVALVNAQEHSQQPVLIVNAITPSGGKAISDMSDGFSIHPRTLVVAQEGAKASIVQSTVDLDDDDNNNDSVDYVPRLYNGYTQFFLHGNSNVTHSYLEESGGMVTPGVELTDDDLAGSGSSGPLPRQVEAQRPQLQDTHLEAIDVHVMGENGDYEGTIVSIGGSGRVRVALSLSLLQTGAQATVNGFSLSGGTQRTDAKTNIHHVAQGTTSRQIQKNLVGGRATGSFRGRVRVEQSAQQTDSEQLSRTVLLSDKARAWSVPSLEIIADDVKCTHGATVSDLSEEELFYLRSRGLGQDMARNLLMYAFAGDISNKVDPAMLGAVDTSEGLQKRIIRRLENLVPQGDRAVKGEFQSI